MRNDSCQQNANKQKHPQKSRDSRDFKIFFAETYVSAIFYVIYLVLLVLGIVMGIKAIVSAKEYAHHKLFLANGLLAIVVPVIPHDRE